MSAAPAEPEAAPLYAFEQRHGRAGSHRDPRQAREQLTILWERLGGDPARLPALERDDPDGWQFLLRYIVDGPLNIQWYDDKRPELEAKQRRYNTLMLVVALVLIALAMALPFQPLLMVLIAPNLDLAEAASHTGLIDVAALVGVVSTGGAVALRLSSHVVRYRRQAAVFHRASAALKEQLYGLESDWAQPPLLDLDCEDDVTRLHPTFAAAIRQAVGTAQSIVADERDAFFETLTVDVNALTDNAVSAVEQLGHRAVFRSDRRHEHAQARQELEQHLSQARLAVATARAKLAALEAEKAKTPPEYATDLVMLIRDQRLALLESEQHVAHLQAELDAVRRID
ncbi:MAG: hypothetical protein AAGF11_24855 [Myxococcota bacterium]